MIEVDGTLNRNERLPCVILVDGSESMLQGDAIGRLNEGLRFFADDLRNDDNAALRVQVLVVRVGGAAEVLVDWVDAIDFLPPVVEARGNTPLGGGVDLALAKIDQQMQLLKANGIGRKTPWLFLMTDGEPTDDYAPAAARCRQAQADGRCFVFPIAVGAHANAHKLKEFASEDRPVVQVDSARFKDLFLFISARSRSASVGPTGAQQDMGMWGKVVA